MQVTHEKVMLTHKPSDEQIQSLVQSYFEAEAKEYNTYNESIEKRRLFLNSIDAIVARSLKNQQANEVLSIACGTGNREVRIAQLAQRPLQYKGIDISEQMVKIAAQVGVDAVHSDWLSAELGEKRYDAVLYLYSFGLVPSWERRVLELQKIYQHLNSDGLLYLDVMNLNDVTEWGPELKKDFVDHKLSNRGYEMGDVFYRRIGANELAYFHYFEETELFKLLKEAKFKVKKVHYIGCGKDFGEIVEAKEGAILVLAQK